MDSPVDPVIRRMQAAEAGAVGALLLRANEGNLAVFPADVALAYRSELRDVAGRAPTSETYVVHVQGRLTGSVTLVPDASDDSHPWPHGAAVLRFLAVDPLARGAGLGELLTVTCLDRARAAGARLLGLHTAPTMAPARRIYERLGFQRAPEHDFDPGAHYGGGTRTQQAPWGLAYLLELGS